MNILALETSTDRLSLALQAGDRLYTRDIVAGQRHAELILGEVDRLLRQAGVSRTALQAIVYGEGPGSFTGLRIACGVAQGLALAVGARVLGIGTLLALAEAADARRVIACIDARMGEVYHAVYEQQQEGWNTVLEPGLYAPDAVPLPSAGDWTGCGSGFAQHEATLRARHGDCLAGVRADVHPTAAAMIRLALPRLAAGEGLPPAQALPTYIRDKVALKISER